MKDLDVLYNEFDVNQRALETVVNLVCDSGPRHTGLFCLLEVISRSQGVALENLHAYMKKQAEPAE